MFKTRKKKLIILLSLIMTTILFFIGCGNPVETAVPSDKQNQSVSSKEVGDKDSFTITYNIEAIEALVGNPFVTPGTGVNDFVYDPLFDYSPLPKDTFLPALGESFEEKGNKLTVKLKKDVRWSDGKPFTSKDVITTMNISFINNGTIWSYLDKVEAPDDYTVVFTWRTEGPILKQMALGASINAPNHIYGKWGDQAIPLMSKRDANGKLDKASDEQRLKIREDLFTYKPKITEIVGTGGWVVENTTSSEILLKKRSDAWCSNNIKFNRLIVIRHTTPEVSTANAIAGKFDGDQLGYTPDVFDQLKKARPDMKVFWVPYGGQPAMFFNTSKYPVNDPLVRKAIAYILDLDAIKPVFEVGVTDADSYVTGVAPSFRDLWLKKDFLAKLTNYKHNNSKAEELLKKAGWKKGSDGFWRDSKDQLVQIEFASMNNWPLFFLGGDAIVNQLNQFGLKAVFKPMEYAAYNAYVKNGEHTVGFQFVGNISYGHPWGSYKNIYKDNMVQIGLKDPKSTSSSTSELKVKIGSGETIDVYETIDKLFYTIDRNEQVKLIEKLAQATNELMPILPIGEKTVPYKLYHTDTKITGYPTDPTDPHWFGGSTGPVYTKLLKYGKVDVKK